jgi:hypothetical protein
MGPLPIIITNTFPTIFLGSDKATMYYCLHFGIIASRFVYLGFHCAAKNDNLKKKLLYFLFIGIFGYILVGMIAIFFYIFLQEMITILATNKNA